MQFSSSSWHHTYHHHISWRNGGGCRPLITPGFRRPFQWGVRIHNLYLYICVFVYLCICLHCPLQWGVPTFQCISIPSHHYKSYPARGGGRRGDDRSQVLLNYWLTDSILNLWQLLVFFSQRQIFFKMPLLLFAQSIVWLLHQPIFVNLFFTTNIHKAKLV